MFFIDTTKVPRVDIGFVLSSTANSANDNFNLMLSAVQSIIKDYGVKKLRYSMVVFGDTPKSELTFNDQFDKDTLVDFVQLRPLPVGSPDLYMALEEAKLLFDPSQGYRTDAMKVLVIMVDKETINSEEERRKSARI